MTLNARVTTTVATKGYGRFAKGVLFCYFELTIAPGRISFSSVR